MRQTDPPDDLAPAEPPARVLLVEDDDSFRRVLSEVLRAHGYEARGCAGGAEALEALRTEGFDLVVTDLMMPGMRGDALLAEVAAAFPELPVIAVTAFGSVESAVALTRAGAVDYLTKPFRTQAFLDSVARALQATAERRARVRARRAIGPHVEGIVGASPSMLRLFDRIGRVGGSAAPVLVTGETGTGKELVARAVHGASGRGAFVPVNCGAIPDHLMESELFGHAKGAFTGADRDKPGLLEAADGGTLFLDEVGELPAGLQPKLLRALESGETRRVGELSTRRVDVRVVSATHRDLAAAARAGTFREDLYWRLAVLHLEIPPLRDRPGDVRLLAEAFLERISARDGAPLRLSGEAIEALAAAPWPGNVRQLRNSLERAAAFCNGGEIHPEDLPADVRASGAAPDAVAAPGAPVRTLAQVERSHVLDTLRRAGGNKTRAAALLGIPRRTLYRRLEEYGLLSPGSADADDASGA